MLPSARLAPRWCKAANSTQLLTVSGAPLHGLWLCLIEDQGLWKKLSKVYNQDSVCTDTQGHGIYVQKLGATWLLSGLGQHLACRWSGYGEWAERPRTWQSRPRPQPGTVTM